MSASSDMGEYAPPTYELSGWWSRVGATVLDGLIVSTVLSLAEHAFGWVQTQQVLNPDGTFNFYFHFQTLGLVVNFVVYCLYYMGLLVRRGVHNGQTLGDQAASIRVLRDDGHPMDALTAMLREGLGKAIFLNLLLSFFLFSNVIAFGENVPPISNTEIVLFVMLVVTGLYLLLDYLWPLWDRENRALHDMIARTHVVRTHTAKTLTLGPAPTPTPATFPSPALAAPTADAWDNTASAPAIMPMS